MNQSTQRVKWFFIFLGSLFFLFQSCKHDPVRPWEDPNYIPTDTTTNPTDTTGNPTDTTGNDTTVVFHPCDPDTVYFERDLLPIFVSNCAKSGCHDPITKEEGIILNSYENIMATGKIRPGRPGNSEVYEVITENDPDKIMPPPPNSSLSSADIAMIRRWIEQGAQNLSCGDSSILTGCQTANMSFARDVQPTLNTHCRGCHNSSGASGGIDLSSHTGVLGPASSGQLYGAISHSTGFKPMPQGGNQLGACQIDKIKAWIDQGAKNN